MHSRLLKWRMISVAAASALTSCAVGPNFHEPNPPGTSGYLHPSSDAAPVRPQAQDVQNISPGAELAGEWWQLFHSAQLDEVVRTAIAASPTLVAANATLAGAREEVTVARGAFLPARRAPAPPRISTASVCPRATTWISLAARAGQSSSSKRSRTFSAMSSPRHI
jgi:outer membrane protein TolC